MAFLNSATREFGVREVQTSLRENRIKLERELIRVDGWEMNEFFFSLSAAYGETKTGAIPSVKICTVHRILVNPNPNP